MDLFQPDGEILPILEDDSILNFKFDHTYDGTVKELIADEKQYLRDLNMITKVFRDLIQKPKLASAEELEAIFSNIIDVTELTMTLIGSVEDTLEMTEEDKVPAIGSCFEELAEAEEFDVYEKYAMDILSPKFRTALDALLCKAETVYALQQAGPGYKKAFKYYLPVLLMEPVYHCFLYFKYIDVSFVLVKLLCKL